MEPPHFDVLVVGAGLSGISAGYHLKTRCPGKRYAILESRDRLGGTWDLFQYPGIRSDSDMYTLGYSFRPWSSPKSIADGPSILAYIRETAEAYGIDKDIRYNKRVERARWSSARARWTLSVRDVATDTVEEMTCAFLFACAGYYDYESGYTPDFPGIERFRGRVVHPQKWTPDIDYAGKRVVVVGSGATAVTLVPELAKDAAHVVMLQRSPTYVLSMPSRDPVAAALGARLPLATAYHATRWKNVALSLGVFTLSRRFPKRARALLERHAARKLRGAVPVDPHFKPPYDPWDQRLCLAADGDLFKALRSGRAEVVTDRIATFTETGVELESGRVLEADLVVTATGLRLKFLGGIELEVDDRRVDPSTLLTYKGMMLSDVPNLALAIGYTNASWTLKCDLTCEYVCRLLNHMDARGRTVACPRRRDPDLRGEPLLDFSSGYVRRSIDRFPRQGSRAPWKLHQNYLLDLVALRRGAIEDGSLELT